MFKKLSKYDVNESFDFGFDDDIEQTNIESDEADQENFYQADTNSFAQMIKDYCGILEKYANDTIKINYNAFKETVNGPNASAACITGANTIYIKNQEFIKELAKWYEDYNYPVLNLDTHEYIPYGTSKENISIFMYIKYGFKNTSLIQLLVNICSLTKDFVPARNFVDFCKFAGLFGKDCNVWKLIDDESADMYGTVVFNKMFDEIHNASADVLEYTLECAKTLLETYQTLSTNAFVLRSSTSLSMFANMQDAERELYFKLYNISLSINFMEIKDSTIQGLKLIQERNKLLDTNNKITLSNLTLFAPSSKQKETLYFLGDNTNPSFFSYLSTLPPYFIPFNDDSNIKLPNPESTYMKKSGLLGMIIAVNNYHFDIDEALSFIQSIVMQCKNPHKLYHKSLLHIKFYDCTFDLDAINVLTNGSCNSISQYDNVQASVDTIKNILKSNENMSIDVKNTLSATLKGNMTCYTLDFDKKCRITSPGEISFSGYDKLNLVIFESKKTIKDCSFIFEKPIDKSLRKENWNLTVVVETKPVPVSSDFQDTPEIYDTSMKRITAKRFGVPCSFVDRRQWSLKEILHPEEVKEDE